VEVGILEEFEAIEEQGGVLGAIERRYQRSQIQAAAHLLESQISSGERSIVGLNRYSDDENRWPNIEMVRTPREKKQLHLDRLHEFHHRHADQSEKSLDALANVVETGGNVFAELVNTVEHCSLGQITNRLSEVVGKFRPMV
jgi:methylmalonyl-CoA mutase N-terminal domain/subunit